MNAKNDALLKTEKEKKIWKNLKMLKKNVEMKLQQYKKEIHVDDMTFIKENL